MLQFEKPILELEQKIGELRRSGFEEGSSEVRNLSRRLKELVGDIYGNLSPWEKVQLARHAKRPTVQDYVRMMFEEFVELHGDRCFGDDRAVLGGLARMGGRRIVVVGHEKGRNTRERLERNFGMAHPEGFRKALRLFRIAGKFALPVVTLVDTPGAYPGIGAEERGQPRAIAENLKEVFSIRTPFVVVIIGEGGSGGALALAVGDRVLMMEHAVYSVISPEGCAAILWKSKEKATEAAESLRLTSADCMELGAVDRVVGEVSGASHRDPRGNAYRLKEVILEELESLESVDIDKLLEAREKKFFMMGVYAEKE